MDQTNPDGSRTFHIAEYEALRAEILAHMTEISRMRQAVVVVPAVIYSALLNVEPLRENVLTLATTLWIPVVFFFIAQSMRNASSKSIRELAQYIAQIEKRYALPDLKGWEHHYLEERKATRSSYRTAERAVGAIVLLAMVAIALIFTAPVISDAINSARLPWTPAPSR